MQKISIGSYLTKIVDKVQYAVAKYEREIGKRACMFMSRKTAESLPFPTINIIKTTEEDRKYFNNSTGIIVEWETTKIFIDDDLEFGEIVIKEYV